MSAVRATMEKPSIMVLPHAEPPASRRRSTAEHRKTCDKVGCNAAEHDVRGSNVSRGGTQRIPRAFSNCRFVIFERPLTFRRFAFS